MIHLTCPRKRITQAFLVAATLGTVVVGPTLLVAGPIHEIVSVEARKEDNPQSHPADIEGGFTKDPSGYSDEIHVINKGVIGTGAGVYNDPINDGAMLIITQEAGPVIASVDGRESIKAIYWVSVKPRPRAGAGKPPELEDLVADVQDVEVILTLSDALSTTGRHETDRTNPSTDAPTLLCSSTSNKGQVAFELRLGDGSLPSTVYSWTITHGAMSLPGELDSANLWSDAAVDLGPGEYELIVTNGSIERTIRFAVFGLSIDGERIDQDLPDTIAWTALPAVVYGGSEGPTADNVRLTATPQGAPDGVLPQSYTWTVDGAEAGLFSPPAESAAAKQWDLGDIPAKPGSYRYSCKAILIPDVTADSSVTTEVGIRTDDYVVIGWINPDGVAITNGATPFVESVFPRGGPNDMTLSQPSAIFFLLDLSECNTSPSWHPLTAGDRQYVLHWLFKYSANPSPTTLLQTGSFRNAANTHIDYDAVAEFPTKHITKFKLFNHLQIRYRVDPDSRGFRGAPTPINDRVTVAIGTTMNPIKNGPLEFPGQSGPANGAGIVVSPNGKTAARINDGSPDAGGIKSFNTLTGGGVQFPEFWESIVSQIRFSSGQVDAQIIVQPYPTYFIYRNGRLVDNRPQAATPYGNFNPTPYPFGTVPTHGNFGIVPGGRSGDAVSKKDPTARWIPAVIN